MQSQIVFYETDVAKHFCKYGEATLMASMMDVHLPCSHLIYLEDQLPKIDEPDIELINSTDGQMIFEYSIDQFPQFQINIDC